MSGGEIDPEKIHTVLTVMDEASFSQPYELSPDGRIVAFVWDATGSWEIYTVPIEGGEPQKITSGPGNKVSPRWSPDGKWIAYLRDQAGDEQFGIWIIPSEGGEARAWVPSQGTTQRFIEWSPDGTMIAFESNRGGQFDIWTIPFQGGEASRLTDHASVYKAPQWSPDGKWIAFTGNRTSHPNNLDIFIVPASGGEERRLISLGDDSLDRAPRWSPDGKRIAFISDKRGRDQVALYELATGAVTWLGDSADEVLSWGPIPGDRSLDWSPDGSRLAYLVNRGDNVALVVRHLSDGSEIVIDAPLGQRLYPSFTRDGQHVLFVYNGPKYPPDIWIASLGDRRSKQITDSLAGRLDQNLLVEPQFVRYPTFDGRTIPALLYIPHFRRADKPPAVLWVHGGPTWQSYNAWDPLIQILVNRGFVVLAPNVRGSIGFGREFRDLNIRDWGGGDLQDLVAGADYLEREGLADGKRIGVAGISYGGYLSLMALTKTPWRWAAGASICGITDMVSLYEHTRGDLRRYLVQQMGTPDENPSLYFDRSPINFVEHIRAPLLLVQGGQDPRVPLGEAELMRRRLVESAKMVEYAVYMDEGHGLTKHENRIDCTNKILAFFQKYL